MKWQELEHTQKTINEYLRLTGGRLSANFTHQYLPLFYSGSADTVMQNIVIALLSSIVQHIGSLSLVKAIGISVPVVNMVFSAAKLKARVNRLPGKKIAGRLKLSVCLAQIWTEQAVLKLARGNKRLSGKYRYQQNETDCPPDYSRRIASA